MLEYLNQPGAAATPDLTDLSELEKQPEPNHDMHRLTLAGAACHARSYVLLRRNQDGSVTLTPGEAETLLRILEGKGGPPVAKA